MSNVTTITPRPFQEKGIVELRKKISEGKKRVILMAPTGAGKGFIMAMLVNLGLAKESDVLTILYGQDLIVQTSNNYYRYYKINSKVIMGGVKSPWQKSTIASISTLSRRALPPADFIIIDECHQSNSSSYKKIFEHYHDKIIIGLSATPINHLTNFEDYIILETVQGLIDLGFLVRPIHFRPKKLINTSGVSISKGEWDDNQLADEALKVTGDIIQEWIDRAKGRATVMFCVNVKHSIELAQSFNQAGIKALHIDSDTPLEERTQAINDLKCGRLDIITNVNIFSTGIDCPIISCIGMARPTHSEILYVQQGGRGLRTCDGKDDCIIIDYSDNVSRFGLLTDDREPNIKPKDKAKKKESGEAEIKVWTCLNCYCCNRANVLICEDCKTPKPVKVATVKECEGELEEVTLSPKRKNLFVADVITFGKYKGKQYSELPFSFIQWGLQNLDEPIRIKLREELKKRMGR